jgi:iron complex outermembrane receptor protein
MPSFRLKPMVVALSALGAPLLSIGTGPVAAQSLSEVVVSASRGAQRSFDAPASVQGVTAETISEAGAQVNLSESINRVPGVVVLNRQNYAQDLQLSIRGFGARSTFGIRGVRLIVDGIPATMPDGQGQASTISLPSAARIEVLRGPLAQLYGNAAGGVVQVFTRDGPEVPYASAVAGFGSYGTSRWGLQTGGQAGTVNYMADYSDFSTDGYRDHSETVRRQFNTKWRFAIGERTTMTVVANAFDQPKSQDPLGLTRAQFEADPRQVASVAITQDTLKKVSQNQVGTVIEHAIDADNKLTGRVYAGQRNLYNKLSVPLSAQTPATSAGGIVDLDRNYAGMGLQFANKTRLAVGQLSTTVGVDYDRMKDRRRGYLNNAGVQGSLKRDEDDTVDSLDFYALTTWLINPDWSVTGGLRSSSVNFKTKDYFIATGNPDDSGSATYRATNPVLGITRHVGEDLNLYANWGRGFETPTFTELAYRNGASGLNFALAASRSRHVEVGAKARLDANHRIDVALFTIGTNNELTVDTNNGGRTTYRNAGRTERKGLELSYSGRWSETVSALLSLTAMEATFRDGFTGSSGAVDAGNRLPGVPDRLVFGEIAWRPKLAGALAGLSAAVEMVHSGKLYVNDTNSDAAASFTLFNLRAGLEQRLGNWRLREFVRVDNVANHKYAGSVIVNDANARFFESAPGRTWLAGVQASYDFR